MRILIATDGSPSAAEAVEYGLELAVELRAEISFLHVLPEQGSPEVRRAFNAEVPAADDLLGQACALAAERGVCASTTTVSGDPGVVIGDVAEAIRADLIVLGSRGPNAADDSVSQEVLRAARRPVVSVRGVHCGAPH